MASTLIRRLQHKIPGWMREFDIPGLSVALVQGSALAWSRGFGVASRQTGRPVTTDSVFEAASLSKPVVACGALHLCDSGLLDLDTPLSDYSPAPYLPSEPRLPLITARRVLCHTAGLPNWRPKDAPLVICLEPGERFSYSGEGYCYLQKVVEQITGRALDHLMRGCILEPLGMSSSSFVWRDAYDDRATQGHDNTGAAVDKWHPDWPKPPITIWQQVSWGLGWGLQHGPGGDAFWHWGDNGSFQALAMAVPAQELGLVSMANSERGRLIWAPLIGEVFGGEQPAIAWLNHLYGQG